MTTSPSPGNSIAITIKYRNQIGAFKTLASVIAESGGSIGQVDIVSSDRSHIVRRITIDTGGDACASATVDSIKALDGVEVIDCHDCTFKLHEGGKLEVVSKSLLNDYVDLSMAYTPGVARVCQAIHKKPEMARYYTIKGNTVAVITDGTAVLGLGNIGALAALPVMEGKAALFKEFGKVNAFPVCVDTLDMETLIQTAIAVSTTFGGINLEDIAAPVCFEVERRVSQAVDIPVFHDDQHGTAVVVGAAFINAIKLTGKSPKDIRAVVCGAGAAGLACTRALKDLGIGDIIVCDRQGSLYCGRDGMNPSKTWLAGETNRENLKGTLKEVLRGSDMFLGLSGPNLLTGDDIRTMNPDPMVFALSNPTPEVPPEAVAGFASVVATGRSDYPNQINNVLCFPGLFRGLFECGAKKVTREMLTAASHAIADVVQSDELSRDFIIPSPFNSTVSDMVSQAVQNVALDSHMTQTPIYFEF